MVFKIDTQHGTNADWADKREPLFEIDGTEYTIPVSVGAEVGLIATRIATEQGELAATMYAVDQTIGREAYDALCAVKGLSQKTLAGIMEVCRAKVFGDMEAEGKG